MGIQASELLTIPALSLEHGELTIRPALRSTTFPAEFILVAGTNPCPCGNGSDPRRTCCCTPPQVKEYLSKISGPLLDRIDLHVEVPPCRSPSLRRCRPAPRRPTCGHRSWPRGPPVETIWAQGHAGQRPDDSRQVRKFCPLKPESMSF